MLKHLTKSSLRSQWIRTGEGFILMYSLTDADSFSKLDAVRTDVLHVKDVDVTPPMGMTASLFLFFYYH